MTLRVLSIVLLFAGMTIGHAQKIKMKKGTIFIDKTAVLSYEKKTHGLEFVISTLQSGDEIMIAFYNDNGTSHVESDDYIKLLFVQEDKTLETDYLAWNKYLIRWLLEQKIIDTKGNYLAENVDLFIKKHDKNISERRLKN